MKLIVEITEGDDDRITVKADTDAVATPKEASVAEAITTAIHAHLAQHASALTGQTQITRQPLTVNPMPDHWSSPSGCHPDCPACAADRSVACQNCDWTGTESELNEIKDYHQRVAAGETAPAGECPSCGALCHLAEKEKPHCEDCGDHGWLVMDGREIQRCDNCERCQSDLEAAVAYFKDNPGARLDKITLKPTA